MRWSPLPWIALGLMCGLILARMIDPAFESEKDRGLASWRARTLQVRSLASGSGPYVHLSLPLSVRGRFEFVVAIHGLEHVCPFADAESASPESLEREVLRIPIGGMEALRIDVLEAVWGVERHVEVTRNDPTLDVFVALQFESDLPGSPPDYVLNPVSQEVFRGIGGM